MSVTPVATVVAVAGITIAVIDATVVADFGCPVTVIPVVEIVVVVVRPIAGRPVKVWLGWLHPGAWDPVITNIAPVPITWHPDKVFARTGRLLINGKRRWTKVHRNHVLRGRYPRDKKHRESKE